MLLRLTRREDSFFFVIDVIPFDGIRGAVRHPRGTYFGFFPLTFFSHDYLFLFINSHFTFYFYFVMILVFIFHTDNTEDKCHHVILSIYHVSSFHSSPRSTNRTLLSQCHPNDDGPEAVQMSLRLAPNGRQGQASNVLIPERGKALRLSRIVWFYGSSQSTQPSRVLMEHGTSPLVEFCRANHLKREAITSSIDARTVSSTTAPDGRSRLLALLMEAQFAASTYSQDA